MPEIGDKILKSETLKKGIPFSYFILPLFLRIYYPNFRFQNSDPEIIQGFFHGISDGFVLPWSYLSSKVYENVSILAISNTGFLYYLGVCIGSIPLSYFFISSFYRIYTAYMEEKNNKTNSGFR